MYLFHKKLKELNVDWNHRALTEDDFHRLCRRFRVRVQEMPLRVAGFYYRVRNIDFIAIDSKLTGPKRLIVMFHELGHFMFHAPDSGATANFHGVGRRTRKELEADLFAICAVLPVTLLRARSVDELLDDGFDSETIAERQAIYEQHGI